MAAPKRGKTVKTKIKTASKAGKRPAPPKPKARAQGKPASAAARPKARATAVAGDASAELRERLVLAEQTLLMQTAKLQVMQEVARVSSGDVSLDEMLELFMDVVLRTTRAEHGSILLLDETGEILTFQCVRGPASVSLKQLNVGIGEGIAGWVARTGQSVLSQDVSKDHRFTGRIAKQVNMEPRGILAVPLKGKRSLQGVVEVLHADGRPAFTQEDLQGLEGLASQMGLVVENAKLFHVHGEEIRRLEALTSASTVVNSTLDLKQLLRLVMELAARTLRAEASSILLKDKATGDLLFDIVTGEAADQVKTLRVPRGQGIAGAVAESGESLLVPDCSRDPRFFKAADEKTQFVTRSIIAVPLQARGETIGVVEVLNRLGDSPFSQADLRLLQALAHQSAVAIQNAQLFADLQESFLATVRALAQAVDAKDSYTAGHSSRVTLYSVIIGEELALDPDQLRRLRLSGLLHDVGKIGIRDSVLGKPGQLTDEEFAVMKSHPTVGEGILKPVPQLAEVIPGVVSHHERFDGRGYPRGLKAEEIPLMGRIIGVADAFDAMTSDRVYRPRLSDEVALAELRKHSGTQFDARVVAAFLAAYDKGLIVTEPSKFKDDKA
jgi:HD-GYP domain-containing protein (c-di-GMP phosphodiesterase class II)